MENADAPSLQHEQDPTPPSHQIASELIATETLPFPALPSLQEIPATTSYATEPSPPPANPIPTLVNTLLFFMVAIVVTTVVGAITIGLGMLLPAFRHQDVRSLALDARLAIPSQAIQYITLLAVTAVIFGNIWKRPFWQAIQWNGTAVARRWILLLAAGATLGLVSGAASNYLPMPKEAPILNDLMRSTAGAWMMFLFGTTLAPLIEELAFRGFLLPSLIHFFERIRARKKSASTSLSLYATSPDSHTPEPHIPEPFSVNPPTSNLPLLAPYSPEPSPHPQSLLITAASILLASIPFALLHAQQVSGAWAPVLLIGLVSVVLCIVRLWTRSLAASTLVHATYNFTLFAGMLIASDGFRHLDKLK